MGRRRSGLTLLAFPSGVLAVLALLVIAGFTGTIAPLPPVRAVASPSLLLLGTFVVLVQVFGEEILLRGLLQPLLTRAWGGWLGILVTALAFTLIHVLGGWRDAVSLLNITLAGIWFGLLALRTSGLLAPTLAHFGYNWGEEMLIGTSPNPGIGDFGSFFDFDLAGPAILGGSVDGFNASLVLSMVLVLLILPLALMRRRVPGAVPAQSEAVGA
ncbi:CAAX amino protease [Sphingomonas sp. KC8]|nr:CAAX amino protease [Sphingomonas sp. KC8]